MKIKHTQKYIKTSPRKIRLVADLIKDLSPEKALEVLPHLQKRAAKPLSKAINTALSNAKDRNISGELVFSEIQINEGPRLKRGRAVSRGRWHPYKRRMSHIHIVLKTTSSKKVKVSLPKKKLSKNDKKSKVSNLKSKTRKTTTAKGDSSKKKGKSKLKR